MSKLIEALENWVSEGLPLKEGHKVLIFFIIVSAVLIYFGAKVLNEVKPTACSPEPYPARCYYVNQDACEIIWSKSELTCKEYIQKLPMAPGRLSGPLLFNCQLMNLDNAFASSRKLNPECNKMFSELKDWKRRHDFQ